MQPLFLTPVFQERIWGGTALRDAYHYDIPFERTGECWAISAHPNGPSIIQNGAFAGETLDRLWKERPELFGYPQENLFPLLTKILDANMDLSVQVHPDDAYAKDHENGELGKTECWYVIDCKQDAYLVFGHTAKTKDELERQMQSGKWDELLQQVKIKPGDFFYVPSGTVHALCEGSLILETQQNSDTTYRIYDYNRRDHKGQLRELHLDKSLDVIIVPHTMTKTTPMIEKKENIEITTFVMSKFFSVYKWHITGSASFNVTDKYLLCSVIKGEGTLTHNGHDYKLTKGAHFILPVESGEIEINSSLELIVSHV